MSVVVALVLGAVALGSGATLYAQGAFAAKPVLDTGETMDYFFEHPFEELQTAIATEPADRRAWRGLYKPTMQLAEGTNLLFIRNSEDYESTEDWKKLTVANRDAAMALGEQVKAKDYAAARTAYEGLVASCNACHEKFNEDAPVFEAWPEPEAR
jgi:cytochrome c553